MAHLDNVASTCGYDTYFAKHVTYPPKGLLPLPGKSVEGDRGCQVWEQIFEAALLVNPAFDIYRIFDTVSQISLLLCPKHDIDVDLVSYPLGRARIPVSFNLILPLLAF